jgi:hypothetical protein
MLYAVGYSDGKYYSGTESEIEALIAPSMVKVENIYANGSTSIRYFETIILMNAYIIGQKKIVRNDADFISIGD